MLMLLCCSGGRVGVVVCLFSIVLFVARGHCWLFSFVSIVVCLFSIVLFVVVRCFLLLFTV